MGKTYKQPSDSEVLSGLLMKPASEQHNGRSYFVEACKYYSAIIEATQAAFPGTEVLGRDRLGMVTLAIPGSHSVFPVQQVRAKLQEMEAEHQGHRPPKR